MTTVESSKPSPTPDQAARKPQAWKGTNPITQRPSNLTAPNGVPATAKPAPPAKAASKESNTPDKHANDRLTFLLANFIGLQCEVTLRNGESFTGIFSSGTPDPPDARYVLKMVKRSESCGQQSNGTANDSDEYVGHGGDHVMIFDTQDVVDLHAANVSTDRSLFRAQNGVSSSFRTDADISGNLAVRERPLQKWEGPSDAPVDLSLDSSSGAAGWDQFETNARMYNVKSDYDENMYTTTIDKSHPEYRARAERAERIAREIEKSSAMNAHVAEERGVKPADDSGIDEEEKYSGVRRDVAPLPTNNPNRYMPPARRPPTGQPTVSGAPVDPAIIQSQLAKSTPSPANEAKDSKQTDKAANKANAEPAARTGEAARPPSVTNNEQIKDGAVKKPSAEASKKPEGNATDTVEHDVMNAFKAFATSEKSKVQHQQRQRSHQEKQMKINDLRKFAQNFKLHTPVPTDLVPILAKDEKKRKEIVEKAKEAAEAVKSTPPKPTSVPAPDSDHKPQRPAPSQQQVQMSPADRANQHQQRRQNQGNAFGGYGPRGQGQMPPRTGPGQLGPRLSYNQQQYRTGGYPPPSMHQPTNLSIPHQVAPHPHHNGMTSPTSATRFNAGAREFKPNAAAPIFSPGGVNQSNSSSPKHEHPPKGLADFWEGRPPAPADQHPSLDSFFNPIKRMAKETESDPQKQKQYINNGGIPEAYRTLPSWDVSEENRELSYAKVFEQAAQVAPHIVASPPHTIMQSGHMPHQHQLPPHLQQNGPMISQGPTPHQTPRHVHAQPHHGQPGAHHFDEHRMQYSHSSSGAHPSPRQVAQYMVPSQHGQQVVYPPMMHGYALNAAGQPVPLPPNAARPGFPQPGMPMGGHMMTQNPSAGPYMQVNPQQMQMYQQSPGQAHVYPHPTGAPMQAPPGAHGAPNGYPSPRPGAPMMQHQGSQQGHGQVHGGPHAGQPVMYMQPGMHGQQPMFVQQGGPMTPMRGPFPGQPGQLQGPYGTSPHQHQHYPVQQPHRGTPSAQYAQPMMAQHSMGGHAPQPQQAGMPPQQPQGPPMPEANGAGEDGK